LRGQIWCVLINLIRDDSEF